VTLHPEEAKNNAGEKAQRACTEKRKGCVSQPREIPNAIYMEIE